MEMADILSLLDVELMVLVVILYFVGEGIKMMQIDNIKMVFDEAPIENSYRIVVIG